LHTHSVGRFPYKLAGLSVGIVKCIFEKMNLTTVLFAPSPNMELDSYVKKISELDEGLSYVLTG